MSKKSKIEELIDVKEYVYHFDIGPVLAQNTTLYTFIIWPNGDSEAIVERLGNSQIKISIPQPLSLKSPDGLLKKAENLGTGIHKVKYFRIDNYDIYLGIYLDIYPGIGKTMLKYQIEDLPPNYSFEGEEAAVFFYSIRKYFWPYSVFIRKDEYNQNELEEFITVHPSSINFRRIQEMATSFYLSKKMPKLGKGKRSLETKKKIQAKNYALYNLIKSNIDGENGIEKALLQINESILENRGPDDDFYGALKKAFYRARKVIETPSPKTTANMTFRKAHPDNQDAEHNSYLLIITPSPE